MPDVTPQANVFFVNNFELDPKASVDDADVICEYAETEDDIVAADATDCEGDGSGFAQANCFLAITFALVVSGSAGAGTD